MIAGVAGPTRCIVSAQPRRTSRRANIPFRDKNDVAAVDGEVVPRRLDSSRFPRAGMPEWFSVSLPCYAGVVRVTRVARGHADAVRNARISRVGKKKNLEVKPNSVLDAARRVASRRGVAWRAWCGVTLPPASTADCLHLDCTA